MSGLLFSGVRTLTRRGQAEGEKEKQPRYGGENVPVYGLKRELLDGSSSFFFFYYYSCYIEWCIHTYLASKKRWVYAAQTASPNRGESDLLS
jgi:hypothetical protein